jgi:hypothetical protein
MEQSRSSQMLRQIREVCEIVGIRTEEYAKVTKKWIDVKALSRELNREKRYLGDRIVELFAREERVDIYEDITIKAIIGRIQDLEEKLGGHEEEISDIHQAAGSRAEDVRSRSRDVMETDPEWETTFGESSQDDEDDETDWDDSDITDAAAQSAESPVDDTVYTNNADDDLEEVDNELIEVDEELDDASGDQEDDPVSDPDKDKRDQ